MSVAITTYHVYVYTGDKFGAGTDANVYIILFGDDKDTGKLFMKSSKTNKNKFERKQMDEFILEGVDIGELKKIKIGHDNAGGGAAWFLDRVEVECLSIGKRFNFQCERWLAKNEDDGKLERELFPQKATNKPTPAGPDPSSAAKKGKKMETEAKPAANEEKKSEINNVDAVKENVPPTKEQQKPKSEEKKEIEEKIEQKAEPLIEKEPQKAKEAQKEEKKQEEKKEEPPKEQTKQQTQEEKLQSETETSKEEIIQPKQQQQLQTQQQFMSQGESEHVNELGQEKSDAVLLHDQITFERTEEPQETQEQQVSEIQVEGQMPDVLETVPKGEFNDGEEQPVETQLNAETVQKIESEIQNKERMSNIEESVEIEQKYSEERSEQPIEIVAEEQTPSGTELSPTDEDEQPICDLEIEKQMCKVTEMEQTVQKVEEQPPSEQPSATEEQPPATKEKLSPESKNLDLEQQPDSFTQVSKLPSEEQKTLFQTEQLSSEAPEETTVQDLESSVTKLEPPFVEEQGVSGTEKEEIPVEGKQVSSESADLDTNISGSEELSEEVFVDQNKESSMQQQQIISLQSEQISVIQTEQTETVIQTQEDLESSVTKLEPPFVEEQGVSSTEIEEIPVEGKQVSSESADIDTYISVSEELSEEVFVDQNKESIMQQQQIISSQSEQISVMQTEQTETVIQTQEDPMAELQKEAQVYDKQGEQSGEAISVKHGQEQVSVIQDSVIQENLLPDFKDKEKTSERLQEQMTSSDTEGQRALNETGVEHSEEPGQELASLTQEETFIQESPLSEVQDKEQASEGLQDQMVSPDEEKAYILQQENTNTQEKQSSEVPVKEKTSERLQEQMANPDAEEQLVLNDKLNEVLTEVSGQELAYVTPQETATQEYQSPKGPDEEIAAERLQEQKLGTEGKMAQSETEEVSEIPGQEQVSVTHQETNIQSYIEEQKFSEVSHEEITSVLQEQMVSPGTEGTEGQIALKETGVEPSEEPSQEQACLTQQETFIQESPLSKVQDKEQASERLQDQKVSPDADRQTALLEEGVELLTEETNTQENQLTEAPNEEKTSERLQELMASPDDEEQVILSEKGIENLPGQELASVTHQEENSSQEIQSSEIQVEENASERVQDQDQVVSPDADRQMALLETGVELLPEVLGQGQACILQQETLEYQLSEVILEEKESERLQQQMTTPDTGGQVVIHEKGIEILSEVSDQEQAFVTCQETAIGENQLSKAPDEEKASEGKLSAESKMAKSETEEGLSEIPGQEQISVTHKENNDESILQENKFLALPNEENTSVLQEQMVSPEGQMASSETGVEVLTEEHYQEQASLTHQEAVFQENQSPEEKTSERLHGQMESSVAEEQVAEIETISDKQTEDQRNIEPSETDSVELQFNAPETTKQPPEDTTDAKAALYEKLPEIQAKENEFSFIKSQEEMAILHEELTPVIFQRGDSVQIMKHIQEHSPVSIYQETPPDSINIVDQPSDVLQLEEGKVEPSFIQMEDKSLSQWETNETFVIQEVPVPPPSEQLKKEQAEYSFKEFITEETNRIPAGDQKEIPGGSTVVVDKIEKGGLLIKFCVQFIRKDIVYIQLYRPTGTEGEYYLIYEVEADSHDLGLGAKEIPALLKATIQPGDILALSCPGGTPPVGHTNLAQEADFLTRLPNGNFVTKKMKLKYSVSVVIQ